MRNIIISFTDSTNPQPAPLDSYKVLIEAISSYERRYHTGGIQSAPDVFFKPLNIKSSCKNVVYKFLITTKMTEGYYSVDFIGVI